jgi:S-DNA-T family DNA segregation ATPase FtsK/SpoIIIE
METDRERVLREVAGTILAVGGVLLVVAIVTYSPLDPSLFAAGSDRIANGLGVVGAAVAGVVVGLFGGLALLLPALLLVTGWRMLRKRELPPFAWQVTAWSAAIAFGGALLSLVVGRTPFRGGEVEWGGEVGRLVLLGLRESLGLAGAVVLSTVGFVAGVAFGVHGSLVEAVGGAVGWLGERRKEWVARRTRRRSEAERERRRLELVKRHRQGSPRPPDPPLVLREVSGVQGFRFRRVAAPAPAEGEKGGEARGRKGEGERPQRAGAVPLEPIQEVFRFDTPLARLPEKSMLLSPMPTPEVDARHLATMRELVEAKCREFRVEGKVEEVLPGPVITTFEFRPAAGVKYAQIVALEEDLALGLQVEAVRIERIPGKATVGIEVPNPQRKTIVLKEILESSRFVHSASPLTLALGQDIHGRPFVADLARMPHLLIGGFTGSGKSVGINAMIMSILFKATPEEVRFILIDPKMVELGIYEKLPHLLSPIISDPRGAARALRWAVRKMRERLQLLAACRVRHITQYNALVAESGSGGGGLVGPEGEELRPLPFIVVIIDELADLMMTCPAEVEESIGYLSQMARAAGIHLIFATQRPSVDIITGVVKANFPCRIAFKVRTRFDSRTILDADGAECLLGMGDMLFLAPGTSRPVRIHGPLVREEEILTVLKHLRRLGKPQFDPTVLEEPEPAVGGGGDDGFEDPMYEQAARLVVASRKASASYLQRKLRLGYTRSARLLDMMEQRGLVGPQAPGSQGREVLVPSDYFGEPGAAPAEREGNADDD